MIRIIPILILLILLPACSGPCGQLAGTLASGLSFRHTGNPLIGSFDGALVSIVADTYCEKVYRENQIREQAVIHIIDSDG